MKIACPHCRAAFALDDKRVPAAGLSIKCPKCKQPFAVHRSKPEDEGKVVEGTPLAVPLPGGPRRPGSSPGAPANSTPPAPHADDSTMVDAAPVSPERSQAVPLPGAADSVREALVPPPPPAPADPYGSRSAASQDGAVPLPGGEPRVPSSQPRLGERAGAIMPPAPEPSFSAIEAASGWQGVEFADAPAEPPPPPSQPGPSDDPFAGIDINVPEDPNSLSSISLDLPPAPAPPVEPEAPAPSAAEAPSDDPFGLDLPAPPAPPPVAAAPAAPIDPGLDFDFVEPPPASPAPSAPAPAPGLLDFVEESKPAPKAAPRTGRPPPMIAPGATAPAPADHAATLAADDEAIAALASAPPPEKEKKGKKEKKPKAPGVPLGVRMREALAPAREALGPSLEKLAELRKQPSAIAGAVAIVALLVVIALGIRASTTSAGLFWRNLWTSSGKQHNAAAREALGRAEAQLSEGSFSAAREALGTAARTYAALPDQEDARSFFVLAAAELKIGWGATGGDWDQASKVVEKMKGNHKDVERAIGAHALAAGDLAKAKALLAPLGDAQGADGESVWLYAQALLRSGEAAHAAQVLDGALKAVPTVKLLLLRGQVERARNKPDEAVKYYEQALAKAPDSGRALVEVADARLKAGDLAGAGALLDRALAPEVQKQLDATEDGHASRLRARLADLQHNGKEAETQFDRAVKLDPNAAETFAAYGLFRLKRREFEKAAKQFDLAIALDSKNPEILGNAARAFLGANRVLDADKRIREALDKDPGSARLIYVSGKVAEVIGKVEEAGKEYERALTKQADLPVALIGVAQLALAAGDKARAREMTEAAEKTPLAAKDALDLEALTELWLALGEPQKARLDAAAAQEKEPEDPYADFAMGRALAALNDLPAARTLYEKSIARVEGDPAMHYELGSLIRRQGNLAGGRTELEKAISLDAKEARFHARLGAVLVEQGEFQAADAQLRQAVLLDDHSSEALYFLGRALIAEKKLSEAVEVLKKAIESDPTDAQSDYQLGLAYAAGSQLLPAGESFTKSTEKDPKNADAWEQLGLTLSAQNLFADALAAFRHAVQLEPERARCWAEIGDAYLQQGDLDHAIESLQRSVRLDAGQAAVWGKLGMAFRDRACDNCRARAVQALKRATEIAPKDPAAFRELAYIYKDDRQRKEAVLAFKRYLELKPDAPDAESINDEIFYLQEEGKRAP